MHYRCNIPQQNIIHISVVSTCLVSGCRRSFYYLYSEFCPYIYTTDRNCSFSDAKNNSSPHMKINVFCRQMSLSSVQCQYILLSAQVCMLKRKHGSLSYSQQCLQNWCAQMQKSTPQLQIPDVRQNISGKKGSNQQERHPTVMTLSWTVRRRL